MAASNILAIACFSEEKQVQAFPSFGVERRGAPVEAYTRIDQDKIIIRTNVYTPDHVVVLDLSLIADEAVTRGLKPGGTLVLNTDHPPPAFHGFGPFSVCTVDANRIARQHHLGTSNSPIVNTAILGAFARASGIVSLDSVCAAIRQEVTSHCEANVVAAREAYQNAVFP